MGLTDKLKRHAHWIWLVAISLFYLCCLPRWVQGGDTGELVAAGYRLWVAHPPGYPLWTWIVYLFTHAIVIDTVFWRASLLSALFAVGALLLISYPIRKSVTALFASAGILALTPTFIESALLPDVFSFHGLLVSAIGAMVFFTDLHSRNRTFWIPFLFFLGLAHHHTIVLLSPVVIGLGIESQNVPWKIKTIIKGTLSGLSLSVLFYLSLLLLNPNDPFSWGHLVDLKSVLHHFLRSDYGTFQLAAGTNPKQFINLLFFIKTNAMPLLTFLVVVFIATYRSFNCFKDIRLFTWFVSTCLSILFLMVTNVPPVGAGAEVVQRFHLMPMIMIAILCGFIVQTFPPTGKRRLFTLAVLSLSLFGQGAHSIGYLSLRQDSVFHDYANNMLVQSSLSNPNNLKSIVLSENENSYFPLRYLQAVLKLQESTLVLAPSLLFYPWYLAKIQTLSPQFVLPQASQIRTSQHLDLEGQLITPNLPTHSFLISQGRPTHESTARVTVLGLGRSLSTGAGTDFNSQSLTALTIRTKPNPGFTPPQAFSKLQLFSHYSYYYLSHAVRLYQDGQSDLARQDWETAVQIVPYAVPALTNLCKLSQDKDPSCLDGSLKQIQETAQGIF